MLARNLKLAVEGLRMKKRKGLDKPIFLIASLTLAIMFVMAYYLATTGWMEGIGGQLNDHVAEFSPEVGGSAGSSGS
ncbi:MAG: hypothetical protein ACI9LV_000058 [Candidatus Nanohaloarchaea archaeon]|jgi:hypothetical protein